jgi:drug/metabolite transporter (DMT)-like permease
VSALAVAPTREWLPWAAFAATSFIWGSTWLTHKWVLDTLTPVGLLCARMSLACVMCFLIGRALKEPLPTRPDVPILLATGLVLTGLANVLTAWCLTIIPSGLGAILQAPIPVWMALLSMGKEPLNRTGWSAAIIGVAGVALVSWPSADEVQHAQVSTSMLVFAYWLCAATAFVWSWASLIQKRRVSSGGLFTNASLQMAQGALISAVLLGGGMDFYTAKATAMTPIAWWSLAYLVVFGSCIAFAAYLYLTKVWHPARAGSFAYLNPVIAVALGYWLNSEPVNARIIVGLVVILLSVGFLQVATRATSSAPKD